MRTVSIVMPVYNEKRFLKQAIDQSVKIRLPGYQKEIIIIDDGSTDGSTEILKEYLKKHKKGSGSRLIGLFNQVNRGKGAALRLGFARARGNIVVVQDADLEYNPADLKHLLKPFDSHAEVVYGSRTLGIIKYHNKYSSLIYYFGGKLLTFYVNMLFGLHLTDQPVGYKLFSKSVIKKLLAKITEDGFAYEIGITAILANDHYKITEVPVTYNPRSIKEGKKIKLSDFISSVLVGFKYKLSR